VYPSHAARPNEPDVSTRYHKYALSANLRALWLSLALDVSVHSEKSSLK